MCADEFDDLSNFYLGWFVFFTEKKLDKCRAGPVEVGTWGRLVADDSHLFDQIYVYDIVFILL